MMDSGKEYLKPSIITSACAISMMLIASMLLVAPYQEVFAKQLDQPDCGDTVTQSLKLKSDIVGCIADGLIIGSDNITLDCKGHSIFSLEIDEFGETYLNSGAGIKLQDRTGVTIMNCDIQHFKGGGSGITLESSSENVLRRNSVSGNFFGIRLELSSNNDILNNDATRNEIGYWINFNSDNNRLEDNTSSGPSSDDYAVFSSSGNLLKGNHAAGIASTGFHISVSPNTHLVNNVATGPGPFSNGVGYDIGFGSDGSLSEDNRASGYGWGFVIQHNADITLLSNEATQNSEAGFLLATTSNNRLENNIGSENGPAIYSGYGGAGFVVFEDATGNLLVSNSANDNTNLGYLDSSIGTGTEGTANTYTGNGCNGNTNGGSSPLGLC